MSNHSERPFYHGFKVRRCLARPERDVAAPIDCVYEDAVIEVNRDGSAEVRWRRSDEEMTELAQIVEDPDRSGWASMDCATIKLLGGGDIVIEGIVPVRDARGNRTGEYRFEKWSQWLHIDNTDEPAIESEYEITIYE